MFTSVSPVLTENLTSYSHSLHPCSSLPRQLVLPSYHCSPSQQRIIMANPLKRKALDDDGADIFRDQPNQSYGPHNDGRLPLDSLPPLRPMQQPYSPEQEEPPFLNSPPVMQTQLQSPMMAQGFLYHEGPPMVQQQMPQSHSSEQPYLPPQEMPQPTYRHYQARSQSDYAYPLPRRNPVDANYAGFMKSAYGEQFIPSMVTPPAYTSIESMIPSVEASLSPIEQLTMGSASSRNSSIASATSNASSDQHTHHKRLSFPQDFHRMSAPYYPSAPYQAPLPPQIPPPLPTLHPPGYARGPTSMAPETQAVKQSKRKSRAKAGTGVRQRSKYTSPSYLLDKRPPDQSGFVNYDHQDGEIIMSAVAPSGNCRRKNNKKRLSVSDLSKKFNSVQK